MATWDNVVAFAPELAAVSVAEQTAYLRLATTLTNTAAYGASKATDAISLMAAHLYTLHRLQASGGGPVSAVSIGSVSVSYATANSGSFLATTPYGAMLKLLQRPLWLTPMVSG